MQSRYISTFTLAFASAAASAVTLDFEGIPGSTHVTTQYSPIGVTFTGGGEQIVTSAEINTAILPFSSGTGALMGVSGYIQGEVSGGATELEFHYSSYSGQVVVRLLDGSSLVGIYSLNNNSPMSDVFSVTGTHYTSFSLTNLDGTFVIDDLKVNPVLEPATMAALGLGLVAMRRRRKA